MPKLIRTLLLILLWIILLGGGFVVFWVRDALLPPTTSAEPVARADRPDHTL